MKQHGTTLSCRNASETAYPGDPLYRTVSVGRGVIARNWG